MADRLTQLQDAVNQDTPRLFVEKVKQAYESPHKLKQAENFCNSAGVLQQFATSSQFLGFERPAGKAPPVPEPNEDYAALFSKLIARTAKDIDVLIDSLPSEESSQELQLASLQRLEAENQESASTLEDVVKRGEELLQNIQQALQDIAQAQLKSQELESSMADT